MDPEHRRKFRDPELISALVACIDFDVLAPSLHSRGILTAAMVDDIKEKEGLDERNLCLLQRLPKRGPLAFDRFVAILREKRMFQAVTLLTGEVLPEPPVSAAVPPSSRPVRAFGGGDARLVVDSAQSGPAGHGTSIGEASDSEMRVVPAKDWKHGDEVYSMVHSPRGMCIIINNCDFGGLAERREGSELDVLRMEALFEAFHFNCIVRQDLPASRRHHRESTLWNCGELSCQYSGTRRHHRWGRLRGDSKQDRVPDRIHVTLAASEPTKECRDS
ncbi:hypothetical protein HPB49_004688 [Dermacentor silvarum]|uniref:Uncharacterized protein n=1 Tax=Dermacentor silvarum TaxID=543639 RepID=A0ACB8D2X7_DERSI|nr:hypothetical protein HPB49_004688 [Dermacentor silvarum]